MLEDHGEKKRRRIMLMCIVAAIGAVIIMGPLRFPLEELEASADAVVEASAFSLEVDAVKLDSIGTCCQFPEYPTGCESVSLQILLQYYGTDVSVAEIREALPRGPLPYEEDGEIYGANPEREFVGDPANGHSLGVFNIPIAQTAQTFRAGAVARSGVPLEELKEIVAGGNPVIAWTFIFYGIEPEVTAIWKDCETGQKIAWTSNEHAVVVYGYDADSIFISDPYTGTKQTIPVEDFRDGYDCFGRRIVYYRH